MRRCFLALLVVLCSICQASSAVEFPSLTDQLRTYEDRVRAKATADRRPAHDLFRAVRDAMAEGKPVAVLDALEVLAGKNNAQGEGGSRTWIRLALALQTQATASRRCDPPGEAKLAAYGAYRRAIDDSERIETLSLLGSLLLREAREDTPETPCVPLDSPEIAGRDDATVAVARAQAYRVFTELGQLAGQERYKAQIEKLSSLRLDAVTFPPSYQNPRFAKSSNKCDNWMPPIDAYTKARQEDQASAATANKEIALYPSDRARCEEHPANHACLLFNRALDETQLADITQRITVRRTDPPSSSGLERPVPSLASVRETRVCYANVAFGGHYEFSIARSLRSADGMSLDKPIIALLDMPDHEPSLGFHTGAYVLPSEGPRKFVMRTMNVRQANLKLRRIGDRNLVREIIHKHILGTIDEKASCFILNHIGERIADGVVNVVGPDNERVPFELPVGAILQKRDEWLRSNPTGPTSEFAPSTAMAFKLFGDQLATHTGEQAGIFAIFGTVQDLPPTQPDGVPAPDPNCPNNIATQWISLTNIGLTLQRGPEFIYVVARKLDTGEAVANAAIELISRSGARLAVEQTDRNGIARIPARLGRGRDANEVVTAMAFHGKDFAFLDIATGAIDLSDRGLEGRSTPGEFDALIIPERGAFRPGQQLKAIALIRDRSGKRPEGLPSFEVVLTNGSGAVVKRQPFNRASPDTDFSREGGFFVEISIPQWTAEGSYSLEARILDRPAGTAAPIEIRHFQPHTVRIDEGSWSATINERNILELSGRTKANYLYGIGSGSGTDAPAANLRAEVNVRIEAADTPMRNCFSKFAFGAGREEFRPQLFRHANVVTGDDGSIAVSLPPEKLSFTGIPLRASIKISLLDLDGTAAERTIEVPLKSTAKRWIGVRPRSDATARTSDARQFEFVVLNDNNAVVREPITFSIYREQTSYVWYKDGSAWDYVSPSAASRETIAEQITAAGVAPTGAQDAACPAPSSFDFQVNRAGNYVVVVADRTGARTELRFTHGWTTGADGSIKPDTLRVWAQKATFTPGERMRVSVESPHDAGWLLGEIISRGEMVGRFDVAVAGKVTTIDVPVDRRQADGPLHIYVTSFRKAAKDSDSITTGPGRAIGGTSVRVGSPSRPALTFVNPPSRRMSTFGRDKIAIELETDGLTGDVWVSLAAVDEGLLLLTDFKTPDPYQHFFGHSRLDFDIFDTYGRLLYSNVGGDGQIPLRGHGYRLSETVSWHSGIRKAANGRIVLEIPTDSIPRNFQGEVRLMAFAWNAQSAVSAEHSFEIRDEYVVQAVAPRAMSAGDTALVPLRVHHVSASEDQRMTLDVSVTGPLRLDTAQIGRNNIDPCGSLSPTSCQRVSVQTRKGQNITAASLPVRATGDGNATIRVSYEVGGVASWRAWDIPIRNSHPTIVRHLVQETIAPGASRVVSRGDFERLIAPGFHTESASLAVRLTRGIPAPSGTGLTAAAEFRQLDHLASELQLLLSETENAVNPQDVQARTERLSQLVGEVAVLQTADGGFVSDSRLVRDIETYVQKDPTVAETAFALDVLSRARGAGLTVPKETTDRATGFLLAQLRKVSDSGDCSRPDRYALAVLSRVDRITAGSFRSVATACSKGAEPLDKLMLVAAHTAFGFTGDAKKMLADARLNEPGNMDSEPEALFRTAALLLESKTPGLEVQQLIRKTGFTAARSLNLITASWMTRASNAASAILEPNQRPFTAADFAVTPPLPGASVNRSGVELKALRRDEIPAAGIQITNRSNTPLQASYLAEGMPRNFGENNSRLFDIQLSLNSSPITDRPPEIKQLETAYFTIDINQNDQYAGSQRLAVVQNLPTGFEGYSRAPESSWVNAVGPTGRPENFSAIPYSEFQDGRWIAILSKRNYAPSQQPKSYRVGFSVTPLLQGDFLLPSVIVRDLNNPDRISWTKPMRIIVKPAN